MNESNWTDYISGDCGLCDQPCAIERINGQSIRIICPNGHHYRVSFRANHMKWTRVDLNQETNSRKKRRESHLARKVVRHLLNQQG